MVLSHLDYAVSVLKPRLKPRLRRNIDALERIQARALRIPYELQKLDGYNERLSAVGLTTREVKRDGGDLIQTYKLIKGLEQVDNHCITKSAPHLRTNGPASALRGRNNLVKESFRAKETTKTVGQLPSDTTS